MSAVSHLVAFGADMYPEKLIRPGLEQVIKLLQMGRLAITAVQME